MAIKNNIELKGTLIGSIDNTNIELKEFIKIWTDCYIKVESVNSTKSRASIMVEIYDEGVKNKIAVKRLEFTPDLESGHNIIKQAYLHLKTLPEFSGALDV
jgi:hypothetical protein